MRKMAVIVGEAIMRDHTSSFAEIQCPTQILHTNRKLKEVADYNMLGGAQSLQ